MAFQNIDTLDLGGLLQIVFSNGVRNQISEDYRDWEMVKRFRVGSTAARSIDFQFLTNYGPSAIQYRNPGQSNRPFPTAQQSSIAEHSAKFKEIQATIELEYNLWDRARKSPEKYAEPLALEIQSKTTGSKRRMAADYYGDGTGVVGEVAAFTDNADGTYTITLSDANDAAGHVGFFEYGDLVQEFQPDGTAGLANVFSVVRKSRRTNQVTLREAADTTGLSFTAGRLLYRSGQPTIPNRTSLLAGSDDWAVATEVLAGLESLVADDGRTVHGITMEGASSGTRESAEGQPLDVSQIQALMDAVKVNAGQDAYKWKMMTMAPEAHSALVESREADRRFQTVEDNKRGIKYFAYVHGNDVLETYTTEYCPKKRIYVTPESKAGKKVMEYYGSDFEPVKVQGGSEFMLKPTAGGGYENTVTSFMNAICTLICKHPASIGVLEDFTL